MFKAGSFVTSGTKVDTMKKIGRIKQSMMAQWLALHSRPVFRDGFLLAYNMWCWNSCWVGSALSFPVDFSSNSKKRSPNWSPRNLHKECAHPNGWRDKHTRTFTHEKINYIWLVFSKKTISCFKGAITSFINTCASFNSCWLFTNLCTFYAT